MSVLLAVMLLAGPARTGEDARGRAVLDSVINVLGRAQDYTVRLEIVVDIERMSVPPMEATLYYKYPDRVHIEADGVAIIPREVLPVAISAIPDRFLVEDSRRDTLRGMEILRLGLEPREATTRTRRLSLAVDPGKWLPVQLATSTVDGRAITADFEFAAEDGFWLPAEVLIRFDAASEDTSDRPSWEQTPPSGRTQRMARRGTVRIVYREYRVNTGLPDELFAPANGREEKPQQRN